jgi:hypothetical protein
MSRNFPKAKDWNNSWVISCLMDADLKFLGSIDTINLEDGCTFKAISSLLHKHWCYCNLLDLVLSRKAGSLALETQRGCTDSSWQVYADHLVACWIPILLLGISYCLNLKVQSLPITNIFPRSSPSLWRSSLFSSSSFRILSRGAAPRYALLRSPETIWSSLRCVE